jgi:hypothetical protein
LNILLSELDAEIRLNINELEKKTGTLIAELPNKLKWCCRMTSNPTRRHTYGKYDLYAKERMAKHARRIELIESEIVALKKGLHV